jgi:hypothetical protein
MTLKEPLSWRPYVYTICTLYLDFSIVDTVNEVYVSTILFRVMGSGTEMTWGRPLGERGWDEEVRGEMRREVTFI